MRGCGVRAQPAYKLHYDAARATNGFKLLLELMDIDDMVRVRE